MDEHECHGTAGADAGCADLGDSSSTAAVDGLPRPQKKLFPLFMAKKERPPPPPSPHADHAVTVETAADGPSPRTEKSATEDALPVEEAIESNARGETRAKKMTKMTKKASTGVPAKKKAGASREPDGGESGSDGDTSRERVAAAPAAAIVEQHPPSTPPQKKRKRKQKETNPEVTDLTQSPIFIQDAAPGAGIGTSNGKVSSSPSDSISANLTKEKKAKRQDKGKGKEIITISDSPIREHVPLKTFADFANEREARKAARKAGGWYGGLEPLWPSRETMHVVYEDDARLSDTSGIIDRRWKGKGSASRAGGVVELEVNGSSGHSMPDDIKALQRALLDARCGSSSGVSENAEPCQSDFAGHPLIHRLQQETLDPSELWTSVCAPRAVAEVLGDANHKNAAYLRDWLKELSLQDSFTSTKSPAKRKIKREVSAKERKRRKLQEKRSKRKYGTGHTDEEDNLDDFIASDSEEEYEGYHDQEFDDFDYGRGQKNGAPSSPGHASQTSTGADHQFHPLTNVILLTGPSGSGKTSTAYAVANELEWQVFEVFPGIGKRSTKDIERYVGMVGQNHIVRRDGQTDPPRGLASIFSKATKPSSASEEAPATKLKPRVVEIDRADLKVRQSVILIEEVDILYSSDQGFWEGLVAFIAKSRRPVILTCNETWTVPLNLLPLQATLAFERLPQTATTSFLASATQALARPATLESIGKMAASSDLRHALAQLQYETTVRAEPFTAASPVEEGPFQLAQSSLRHCLGVLENCSFANAQIARRPFMEMEDEEVLPWSEEDAPCVDSGRPVYHLPPPIPLPLDRPLPCFAREEEMVEAIQAAESATDSNVLKIRKCTEDALAVASELFDFRLYYNPDSSLHTELMPYVREIVSSEDIAEQLYHEALAAEAEDLVLDSRVRRSRRLANTGKEKFPRRLPLEDDLANLIRQTAFTVQLDES